MKKIIFSLILSINALFAKNIVILEPSSIEIIFMLEAQDSIAAIAKTQSSDIWPQEEVAKLASIGTYIKPNLEKIVEINPDLVLVSYHSSSIINDLDRFNIKHEMIQANSIDDIYKNIIKIGKFVVKEKESKKIIDDFQNRINALKFDKLKDKKALFFYSATNLLSFGKDTLPDSIFKIMGIKNIASKLKGSNPIVSPEYLLEENPDFMLVVSNGNVDDFLKQYPILRHTNAVKNNKIFIINGSSLLRGTPRIINEIEKIYSEFIK
ncbi:heme ABC transporter ChuBCD, periplasmic substrate-binding protein [Campylobacter blaseri]|uniref:Hemin ABC transporter substrate-binding protein n=1 Tax=Campylobacter blaseri TaxID=2042961 RepID=A0A2P8R3Z7_9BACT|nr:ABC transporter substrate-binding protein [Campylobacter blaseri]PSM53237.1 hemin ABC transporter substrate-binding protein [Campylobacter blaseri]PSM54703.1 hemin ABC transporter substrate-binding protein [Campylobacter blaseri]QKF86814.1 heme ABC transporter ChuBCD, periplasmic substrate-binding protein [Campylobacter blaseri]